MTEYRAPLLDQRFVLEHVAGLAELSGLDGFEHADLDTVVGLLAEAAPFFEEVIAPLNVVGDTQGARVEGDRVVLPDGWPEAYRAYVDAGWGAIPFDPEFGGGGLPWVVGLAVQEMLTSACMSFSLAPLLTQGAVDMLSAHGSAEQKATWLEKMISGEWTGTMNLTEPQAGSDVGAVRTRAVPAGDGTYRITGQKIYITYGEHELTDNIVHLVLARTPDAAPGTRGISCFIVPKYLLDADGSPGERNAVTAVSSERKVGIHASPTCVMDYDDAVGYLIGDEQQGMRYMFTMMNNARLSVGLQGLALAERAYQQAVEHARERRQGRAPESGRPRGEASPIVDHADVRRMLLLMRCQIEAMRCVHYRNGAALDRSHRGATDDERARGEAEAALLTPISKGWGTDLGVELTSLAIQVFGGMGYVEETGVAQHWRDARISPIYEGTNGIQALDLVSRKLGMAGGTVVKAEIERMRGVAADLAGCELDDDSGTLASIGVRLADAVDALEEAVAGLGADPTAGPAGSTPMMRLFGIVEGGADLARSALVARRLTDAGGGGYPEGFLADKVATARVYADQILPQARGLVPSVLAGPDPLFAIPADRL